MNVAIVGPGAIGLLLAGYLKRAGAEVALVDHSAERADFLGKGVRWEGIDADFTFIAPVTVGLQDPEKYDLVVICVKANRTDAAARQLSAAGYRGAVMTLQNGAGNIEIIGRNLPDSPLIAGVTSEGAYLAGSMNHVRHAGKGKVSFGAAAAGKPGREFLQKVAALFQGAEIEVELTEDPGSLIWGKVLTNAGINALTAIFQVQNGRLLTIEPARKLMSDLVLEGSEVLKRKNVSLPYGDPLARVEEVCRLTAGNYSSMYMDIKKGRPTEIDFINGAIAQEGAALNVPCPYNDAITKIVHALELVRSG